MADSLSKEARSERMSRIGGKNTGPELAVRKCVHAMGYRYRLHGRDLPGSPDLVFPGRKRVIFVHGCFWHRHSDPNCRLARLPKSRVDFWAPKFKENSRRDQVNEQRLKELGWKILTIWECELKDEAFLKAKIESFFSDEVD